MIRIVTNSEGSGDWVQVYLLTKSKDGKEVVSEETVFEGHSLTPMALFEVLRSIEYSTELITCTDTELEEGTWRE